MNDNDLIDDSNIDATHRIKASTLATYSDEAAGCEIDKVYEELKATEDTRLWKILRKMLDDDGYNVKVAYEDLPVSFMSW